MTDFVRNGPSGPKVSLGALDLDNVVFVESVADLPDAVAGIRDLEAKTYVSTNGLVNIGTDQLRVQAGTSLLGLAFGNDGFTRDAGATGPLLIIPAGLGNFSIDVCRFVAPTGSTVLQVEGAGTNVFINRSSTDGDIGEITGGGVISIFTSAFNNWDTGLVVKDVVSFQIVACSLIQKVGGTGVGIDLQGTVLRGIDILADTIDTQAGGTGIKGLASNGNLPAGVLGRINTVTYTGGGTTLAGISVDDLQWTVANTQGSPGSLSIGSYGMSGNATATTATSWAKVAGTTTVIQARRFAHSTNRVTYQGLTPKPFRVDVGLTAKSSINGTDAEFGVSINGAEPVEGVPLELSNNKFAPLTFFIPPTANLTENDYVEVWCRDTAGAANITVEDMRVMASAIASGT